MSNRGATVAVIEEDTYRLLDGESVTSVEKLVLGACFGGPEALSQVTESLTLDDFALEKHRRIFAALLDLSEFSIPVDRVTLAQSLLARGQLEAVDGLGYLVSLDAGLPTLHNLWSYIQIIREKSALRRLVKIGHDLCSSAAEAAANPAEIVRRVDDLLYTSFRKLERSQTQSIGDYIESQPINELLNPSMLGAGLMSGFTELDELTNGLHNAEIWIFGADPGVGKTSIALQIAKFTAEKDNPVLVYSLEMPKKALITRLICQHAEVPIIRFRAGDLNPKERMRLSEAADYVRKLPIYFDDTPRLKPSDLLRRTKRAKEKHGVKLAVLDFLQKVRAPNPRKQGNEQMSDICDEMVEIAKETVPWVVMSQLSRTHKKEKRDPSMEDLRNSGAIEQMGHVIVFPVREDMAKGDTTTRGKSKFIVGKHRDGELRTIPMQYIGWRLMYKDVEPQAPRSQYWD